MPPPQAFRALVFRGCEVLAAVALLLVAFQGIAAAQAPAPTGVASETRESVGGGDFEVVIFWQYDNCHFSRHCVRTAGLLQRRGVRSASHCRPYLFNSGEGALSQASGMFHPGFTRVESYRPELSRGLRSIGSNLFSRCCRASFLRRGPTGRMPI